MVNHWLFLAVFSGITTSIFNAINRHTLRDGQDSSVYGWLFEVTRVLFFALLLPWQVQMVWTPRNLLILFALGLSELAGVYLYMKMHSSTELSLSATLMKLRIIIIPIFAYLFLREQLTWFQYFSIVLVFAGCLVVSLPRRSAKFSPSHKYALAFSVVSALSSVLLKQTTSFASTSVATFAFSLPAAILLPFLMRQGWSRIKNNARQLARPTLLAAVFNIVTMYSQIEALRLGTAGQVLGVLMGWPRSPS